MSVLFFLHSLSCGGAERVTSTLANYWADQGRSVEIVTLTPQSQDFYALHPTIKRITLDLAVGSRSPQAAFYNLLRRVSGLRRVLRQVQPDVAIAMMSTPNVILALAALGLPVVVIGSERTYPPAYPLGTAWEWLRRRTYPKLDWLVAQTEQSAAWIHEHAPARKIAVIPNPVTYPLAAHEPRLAPAPIITTLRGSYVLLAIGRLDESKGFDRLLNSFAAVATSHSEWSLVILGQGALYDDLLRLTHDLGVSDRVAFPGAVGNVAEWFEASDLYVMTSRREGFPNTLLEAMAHGMPVVAVDCETGPREILRHEVDGLLVPQDDADALAFALDRMMGDPELRERFSARAAEVRDRFSLQRIAGLWEDLFMESI